MEVCYIGPAYAGFRIQTISNFIWKISNKFWTETVEIVYIPYKTLFLLLFTITLIVLVKRKWAFNLSSKWLLCVIGRIFLNPAASMCNIGVPSALVFTLCLRIAVSKKSVYIRFVLWTIFSFFSRSFIVSGGSAVYVAAYSLFYFMTKLEIDEFVPTLLYFSYTIIMVLTFW